MHMRVHRSGPLIPWVFGDSRRRTALENRNLYQEVALLRRGRRRVGRRPIRHVQPVTARNGSVGDAEPRADRSRGARHAVWAGGAVLRRLCMTRGAPDGDTDAHAKTDARRLWPCGPRSHRSPDGRARNAPDGFGATTCRHRHRLHAAPGGAVRVCCGGVQWRSLGSREDERKREGGPALPLYNILEVVDSYTTTIYRVISSCDISSACTHSAGGQTTRADWPTSAWNE